VCDQMDDASSTVSTSVHSLARAGELPGLKNTESIETPKQPKKKQLLVPKPPLSALA